MYDKNGKEIQAKCYFEKKCPAQKDRPPHKYELEKECKCCKYFVDHGSEGIIS